MRIVLQEVSGPRHRQILHPDSRASYISLKSLKCLSDDLGKMFVAERDYGKTQVQCMPAAHLVGRQVMYPKRWGI